MDSGLIVFLLIEKDVLGRYHAWTARCSRLQMFLQKQDLLIEAGNVMEKIVKTFGKTSENDIQMVACPFNVAYPQFCLLNEVYFHPSTCISVHTIKYLKPSQLGFQPTYQSRMSHWVPQCVHVVKNMTWTLTDPACGNMSIVGQVGNMEHK